MPSEKNQQIKILIVDDEKYIADILVDIISDKGRSVDVCYDGCDAVSRIENSFYDLIIVDLVMPKVGGLDVLKYAKKANPDVLVIIDSGHGRQRRRLRLYQETVQARGIQDCRRKCR